MRNRKRISNEIPRKLNEVVNGVGGGGEGERAVLGLVLLLVVGVEGCEVDAGAALKGGEEGGDHGGADPRSHVAQAFPRKYAVVGVVFFHVGRFQDFTNLKLQVLKFKNGRNPNL